MKKTIELKWDQLKPIYHPSDFHFQKIDLTDEYTSKEIDALELGLKIQAKGYNIYLSGVDEESMLEHITERVSEQAKEQPIPEDLCYIYNFKQPSNPKLVNLVHGEGKQFAQNMLEFKHFIIDELPEKLESDTLKLQKEALTEAFELEKQNQIDLLEEKAYPIGLKAELTSEGIRLMPVDEEGNFISLETFEKTKDEDAEEKKAKVEEVYLLAEKSIEVIEKLEKVYQQETQALEEEVLLKEMTCIINQLKRKYRNYDVLQVYFESILEELMENMDLLSTKEALAGEAIKGLFPFTSQKGIEDLLENYEVNVLVDHSETKGAPIIYSTNLSYTHLIGSIKIENELTAARLTYKNIVPGLLHQANGGYIVIKMSDLIDYPGAWEGIKHVLKTGNLTIENLPSTTNVTTLGMIPEPVKAHFKVILIGSYELYSLLSENDRMFKDFFKINVDFEEVIESNEEKRYQFIEKVEAFCQKEQLPLVTTNGMMRLLEMSHREAESAKKMTCNMQPIYDTLREASLFATDCITGEAIVKARKIKTIFKETIQKNTEERYDKNLIMIDTTGKKIGQINGLAVYTLDDYRFGRPMRITATTYRGKGGIVDVEAQVGLSGSIHAKGVQIITGFLGNQYAKEFPLALSCRICFEQNYGGIDGDSASAAELFTVISSLADVPIRQGIAVTGSINQYGEIQPVGGVNDKIEGFYKVCKKKGLTGNQGVILPYQNVEDLVLDDEVVEAVKEGTFHIYAIKDFKEGIQLLTGKRYTHIYEKVMEKLKSYAE